VRKGDAVVDAGCGFGSVQADPRLLLLALWDASLRPDGTMTMIVWRGINDNPWLGFAKQIVLQYLPPPGENAQTCGPGPFSMADTGVVTKQLEIAGYKDIRFEQIDAQVFVGKDWTMPLRSSLRSVRRARSTARLARSPNIATTRLPKRSRQNSPNLKGGTASR
jgi:hypothetical protein